MERGDGNPYRFLQSHLRSGESLGKQGRGKSDTGKLAMSHREATQISIQSPSMRENTMHSVYVGSRTMSAKVKDRIFPAKAVQEGSSSRILTPQMPSFLCLLC